MTDSERPWTSGEWTWSVENESYPETTLSSNGVEVLRIYESHGGGQMPKAANAELITLTAVFAEAILHAASCDGWVWADDREVTDAYPCDRCDNYREIEALAAKIRKIGTT